MTEEKKLHPYIVEVNGETYHVSAFSEEAAALIFWSNSLPHLPNKEDVKVTVDEGVNLDTRKPRS